MHVCLLVSVPLPPEEGVGHHIWNLAHQLSQRGHQVTIVTRGRAAPMIKEKKDAITVWRAPFVPAYPFHVHVHGYFVNKLLRQIEDQFDLINAHTPLPPAVNASLPMVTTVHTPMRSDTAAIVGRGLRHLAVHLQTPISQWIETALFRRSEKITAVASWVAEALEPYGVNPASVTITGNGVEKCFLDKTPVQNKEPLVLYAGRIALGKGLEELVEAARIVIRQYSQYSDPDLRFVLAGKGPLLAKLRDRVSQAGMQRYFTFVGHVGAGRREDLVRLYRKALLFVLPSHHEGMSTVLLEAMASGLPVVSTAVGGAVEVVVDRENGLLIPPREPNALAAALLTLLKDVSLRDYLGRNARKTIERSYSWDAVGERYLACYEQVVNNHNPHAGSF
jgi:glycosyltransferase involved in cell wall biosynthesis